MDSSLLSGFGAGFATSLAADIVKKGLAHVRDGALGRTEAGALARCLDRALSHALEEISPTTVQDSTAIAVEVHGVLTTILSEASVARALTTAALTGTCDATHLTSLAHHAGLDPSTLPFDWGEFLVRLLARLEWELREEAGSSDSKLRDRVALNELFRLRCAVTEVAETLSQAIDRLTASLADADPTGLVVDFLKEYLGRPGHPKPFGGRAHEIALLNDWLLDPGGSPKLLMVAPAGRGKSALLVHWLRQLPPDVATVFVPVSQRFVTAQPITFMSALVHGLARLHERQPDAANLAFRSVDALRAAAFSQMRQPTSTRRLIVITVDGIDEAADRFRWAGLFPDDLPENVRIVVSARQVAGDQLSESWMRSLAWDSFPGRVRSFRLEGLDRDGVADVLRRMPLPLGYAAQTAVIDEIHRLSQGDPLMVGLYAERLWEQHRDASLSSWTVDDLKKLPAGPQGFFERWFDDQRRLWGESSPLQESRTRAVLAILAQVLGPLLAGELRELMRRAYGIDDWSVRDALAPLARFVIGDGIRQGYSLTHPRLNEFFSSVTFVSPEECRRIEDSVMAWGRQVLARLDERALPPQEVPVYLLRHLGAHFVVGHAPLADRARLVSAGWGAAWRHVDPTGRGFLGDVQRAWEAGLGAPDGSLGLRVRCVLCFGSIQSPFRLPPASVLQAALDTGVLNAHQVLHMLADGLDRDSFTDRVEELASVLPGDVGVALASLADLAEVSLPKVSALAAIARRLTGADKTYVTDKALRAARACETEIERTCASLTLLDLLLERRRGDEIRLAVERLSASDSPRIRPTMVWGLARWAPAEAARLADRVARRSFASTALAPDPALGDVLGLLSAGQRQPYIQVVLDWPVDKLVATGADLLRAVGRWMDHDQRSVLVARTATLPFADALVVLSRLEFDHVAAAVPDLFERVAEAVSSGDSASLYAVHWPNLLSGFDEEQRAGLLKGLLSLKVFPVGSSQWMDLVAVLLSLVSGLERRSLAALALSCGRRNFDELVALEILGKTLRLLPAGDQESARARLDERVSRYCTRDPIARDPAHARMAVALLPYVAPETASSLGATFFAAGPSPDGLKTSFLAGVIPYLTGPAQDEAVRGIRRLALKRRASAIGLSVLEDARPWLSDDEFHGAVARLVSAAEVTGDDQALAELLPALPSASRHTLSARLFETVKGRPDVGYGWVPVVGELIRAGEIEWLRSDIRPFLTERSTRYPEESSRLLFEMAKRVPLDERRELVAASLAASPLLAWDRNRRIELIAMREPRDRRRMIESVLLEMVDGSRVVQLAALQRLLPLVHELARDVVPEIWEAIWDTSLLWP